jgi:hypothetical protein
MNFQLEENQPHGPGAHRLHVARRPCMFFRFSLHFTFSEVSFQVFSLVSESACEHSIQTVQLHCAILGCNLTTFSVIHGSTACSLPGNTLSGPVHAFLCQHGCRSCTHALPRALFFPHAHYGHFLFTESLCQLPTGFFYAGKTTGRGNVVGLPVVQIFKGEYSSQCSMVWRK